MSYRQMVLWAAVLSFLGGFGGTVRAATFNIDGVLDLNGQIIDVGSSTALNLTIDGSMANSANVGYLLSVTMSGAPITTGTTTNVVPFIGASVTANVNGATAVANTGNCSTGCGLFHQTSGNLFSISNLDRDLSISLAAAFLTIGAIGNLPDNDVITLAYNLTLNLPQGLSAQIATPLPGSFWLFASGMGILAWGFRRKNRLLPV